MLTAAATVAACAGQPPTVPSHPPVAAQPNRPYIGYGYQRVVSRDGTELFCRNDLVTGSHAQRQMVCLTAVQWQASQDAGEAFLTGVESRDVGAAGKNELGAGNYFGHSASPNQQ